VEVATLAGGPPRSVFYGLAVSRGFTERECALAARTGRLIDIINCPPVETRSHRASGTLSGAVALVRLHELQSKLLDARLAGLL
jgi:hypothetical protein